MIGGLRFVEDDLTGEAIAALLRLHLEDMYRWSPWESVHAMPIERLREPDVTFYSAWDGTRLAGCGGLKHLDADHGEIKSMRAAPGYRGRGVGRAILLHLLGAAMARGYRRVSLETGASDHYRPARCLYETEGFAECAPFADYAEDLNSIFLTRLID